VATLASPSVDTTNPTPNVAHIEWTSVPSPNSPTLDSEIEYTVERQPTSGSTWVFVCGTDVTPKPYNVLSCNENLTVEDDYDYRVTAHFRSWTSEGTDSVHVVVDLTPPEVDTITRDDTSPTNASEVSWTVIFTESVTGVDETDFDLVGTGSTGASVTDASGGGDTYIVTADTGDDGTPGAQPRGRRLDRGRRAQPARRHRDKTATAPVRLRRRQDRTHGDRRAEDRTADPTNTLRSSSPCTSAVGFRLQRD
jgi:hypothetical protein